MKLKYTSKWEPRDSWMRGIRGDEKRTFTVDGVDGWMDVTESNGGWNHQVWVGGKNSFNAELIDSNRSWGERRKAQAMSNAIHALRRWISIQEKKEN